MPRHRHARPLGELPQQIPLAFGQFDRLGATHQFPTPDQERGIAHFDFVPRRRRQVPAPQDILQAQQQLAGLERLGDIVFDANLKAFNAVFRIAFGCQHANRHCRCPLQVAGEGNPVFAGHHDVKNDQIERQPAHGGPCGNSIGRWRYAEAIFGEKARQQVPDPVIVINHQNMRGVVWQWFRFSRAQ